MLLGVGGHLTVDFCSIDEPVDVCRVHAVCEPAYLGYGHVFKRSCEVWLFALRFCILLEAGLPVACDLDDIRVCSFDQGFCCLFAGCYTLPDSTSAWAAFTISDVMPEKI